MAKRTYFSRHIPSGSMDSKQVEAVLSDIDTFNRIMHKAAASQYVKNHSDRREKAAVDRRKKENRHLITETSFHCLVKEEYGVDDHFANSAVNEAKASIQSVKELNKLNIDECTSQLRDLKKKRSDVRRTLTRLKKIKNVLILASKKKAAGKESFCTLRGPIEKYDRETGSFRIMKGEKVLRVYENPYLFEVRYVDPKIRRCKNIISQLDRRETRLNDRITRMKNKLPGICFGSKKFFARQYDKKRYPDHSVWLNVFRKKRSHALMISGRKDASQGNYRFRYDSLKHELTYISQSGMHIIFPDVEFPRGQDAVNHAVNAKKEERKPVAWRIIRTGGSFLIQCIITVKEVEYSNYYYRNGCIAMDTNYDNFSVCEIDGSGNLLSHRIIPFDLEKAS